MLLDALERLLDLARRRSRALRRRAAPLHGAQFRERHRELLVALHELLLRLPPLRDFALELVIHGFQFRRPLLHARLQPGIVQPPGHLPALALDRILDRAQQELHVHMPLHEVILRALLHQLDGRRHIRDPAQDHDRHIRRSFIHPVKGRDSGAVRQRQIQQHDVPPAPGRHADSLSERRRGRHGEHGILGSTKKAPEQFGVLQIILDEENPDRTVGDGHFCFG